MPRAPGHPLLVERGNSDEGATCSLPNILKAPTRVSRTTRSQWPNRATVRTVLTVLKAVQSGAPLWATAPGGKRQGLRGEGAAREAGTRARDGRTRHGRGAWRLGGSVGCAPAVGRARDGPGASRADVGAATPCTRQTTQKRRDNSPRRRPPALRPWRIPGKAPQRCRSGQEVDRKPSWACLRLGALAPGNGR